MTDRRSSLPFFSLCASLLLACSSDAGGGAASGSSTATATPKKATTEASSKPSAAAATATATALPAAPAPLLPDWAKDRGTEEIMGLHLPGKVSKKEIPPQWYETGLSAKFWYDGADPADLAKAMQFYFAQDGWKIEATKEIVGNPVYTVSKDGTTLDVSCAEQISAKKGFIFVKKG